MPKPNRYQGNGKLYPEGSVMGRYVMKRGHWVDIDSPVARATKTPRKGLNGWLVLAMWAVIVILFVGALTGCSVNTVVINNADIGVQTALEHLEEYKACN